jgi:hypothetical protein
MFGKPFKQFIKGKVCEDFGNNWASFRQAFIA